MACDPPCEHPGHPRSSSPFLPEVPARAFSCFSCSIPSSVTYRRHQPLNSKKGRWGKNGPRKETKAERESSAFFSHPTLTPCEAQNDKAVCLGGNALHLGVHDQPTTARGERAPVADNVQSQLGKATGPLKPCKPHIWGWSLGGATLWRPVPSFFSPSLQPLLVYLSPSDLSMRLRAIEVHVVSGDCDLR